MAQVLKYNTLYLGVYYCSPMIQGIVFMLTWKVLYEGGRNQIGKTNKDVSCFVHSYYILFHCKWMRRYAGRFQF